MKFMMMVISLTFIGLTLGCGKEKSKKNKDIKIIAPESIDERGPTTPNQPTARYVSDECPENSRDQCNHLREEIERLEQVRDQADRQQDKHAIHQANLDLSYYYKMLGLYVKNEADLEQQLAEQKARYESLNEVLASQMIIANQNFPLYSPEELLAVQEVFNDFGPLYIQESTNTANNRTASVAAMEESLPWTSYWYPKRMDHLFASDNSPLAKFDLLVTKAGKTPNAVAWEKSSFNLNVGEWEGLCDAWAMASIMTKEPKTSIVFQDVTFSISDIKALTIKMFEGSKPKIYGRRYIGDYTTDGEIQDLRPEAFHRLVKSIVVEQKRPLIIDSDPGPEVWAKPLFQMPWTITKDPEVENAFLVKAWPRFVDYRDFIDDKPTNINDIKVQTYEYRLYVDPDQKNDKGEYKVLFGEWINSSMSLHPDVVFIPTDVYEPINKGLAENIDLLKSLLREAEVLP